jgi:L-serine dehydratase
MRFKDVFSIIGPAMVGPSSSHTAGAVRIGRVARQLLGAGTPERAIVTFYGSFADTYQGHGTDLAVIAGLLDCDTDDSRIPHSREEAEKAGMAVEFRIGVNPLYHPNTVRLELFKGERRLTAAGSSIGGGNVEMFSVDGFDVKFTGMYPTLVLYHRDRPGMIADVAELLRRHHLNIGSMDVDRKARSGDALTVMEVDSPVSEEIAGDLGRISEVRDVRTIDLTKRGRP